LRARRLTLKVVINDMDINKTFAPDPFSTVGELIQDIQQRMGEKLHTLPQSPVAQSPFVSQGTGSGPVDKIPSPTQSQALANNVSEGYGMFLTPLEQSKDFLYGVWLNNDQMIGSYDLINQGVAHFVRKEWQIKVAFLSNLVDGSTSNPDDTVQGTPSLKTFKVNPFWTVNELLFFILKSVVKKQSPQQSDFLLFMPFNNNNNLSLTPEALHHLGGPGALYLNPQDRNPKLLPHPQTYEFYCGGTFLDSDKLLNYYYNFYDGLANDVIELKRVMRTQKILFIDNTSLVLQFSELTKVEAVMNILCEQIRMSQPNNFRFMAQTTLSDGTIYERWLRPDLTFAEQRVALNHKVYFKNKYLLSDNNAYETALDPQNQLIPLSYAQACQLVNSGRYKLPTQALFLLQSLQLQVMVIEQDPNQQAFLQQFESVFGTMSMKDASNDSNNKGKAQPTEESIQAKLKYLQICQSPLMYDDNTLMQPAKPSGSLITFQVTVKGIFQKDQNFNKNLPVIVEVDTQKKSITFIQPTPSPTDPAAPNPVTPKPPQPGPQQQPTASSSPTVGGSMFIPKEFGQQPQGSIAQTNNIILRLRLEDLKYASLKLDKGTMVTNASEKSKFRTVSIINYFDRMMSAHRTCTIKFQSYVEREFFYFLLHSFLYSTSSLSNSALRKSVEASKSTLGASVDSLGFKRVPIKIFVGTFNMGGVSLGGQDGLWIPPSTANVDLYVLGVQECWEEWNKGIVQHIANINSGQRYEVLAELQMWEMGMIILVNSKHANHVRDVQTANKPTGFASIVGNKGGVGIGFRLYETNFCFISSHLPARAERVPNRNQDFGGLVEALDLGMRKVDLVNQFHHLIWLGDLNYRIDLSREKILTLIEQNFHDGLLRGDQLLREKDKLRTFYAFNEGKIQFWPTYRYERGNNEWSKKKLKNVPSYCDRVLWRSISGLKIHQKYYSACMDLMTSDHRAVHTLFTTEVKTCIPAAPDQLCQMLLETETYPSFQLIFYNLELTRVEEAIEPLLTKTPNKRTSLKSVIGIGGTDDVEEKKVVVVDNIVLRAPFLPSVTHYIPLQRIIEGQTWRSKQELDIVGPFQCLPQSLRKEYMLVQVYSGSEDMVIGSTVIPLYDNVIQGSNWPICCSVTYRGILWGYLTAEIEIKQLTDFH